MLSGKPAVLAYDDLGAYKYLLRVAVDGGVRDATVDAVAKLADYDAQRGAQLLATLEEFLRRHGIISATSEALYVHPNTLRQRLRRIGELSGLDLRRDDWLMIEIAVKMVQLQQALGHGERPNRTHRAPYEGVEDSHHLHSRGARRGRTHRYRAYRGGVAMATDDDCRRDPEGHRRRAASSSSSRSSSTCTRGRARSSCRSARASLDDLVEDGAGFAGFAAGEIGQVPSDPDIAAIPDLASFTPVPWQPNLARFACDVTVEGEEWPYCPRTILRRQLAQARGAGLRVQDRARARVLPRARSATTARSRSPTRSTRSRSPATTCAGLTRQLRLPDDGLALLQRARLGQLRERPRGRERPVRAELHLRRRARQLRPRDLLPLHGAHARGAARA